jgi:Zn-finger nucleic acid-binding protein
MSATESLICPKCRGELRTYERSGVLVDQCSDCRGIFLDRGELERLMDAEFAATASPNASDQGRDRDRDDDGDRQARDGQEANRQLDPRGRSAVPDGRRRESRFGGLMDLFGGD